MSSAFEQLRRDLGPDVMHWRWGGTSLGTAPLRASSGLLDQIFSIAPVEIEGGRETVNNAAMSLLDPLDSHLQSFREKSSMSVQRRSHQRRTRLGSRFTFWTSTERTSLIGLLRGAWRVGTLETDQVSLPLRMCCYSAMAQ